MPTVSKTTRLAVIVLVRSAVEDEKLALRFFSRGIGSSVSKDLLKRIAEVGEGTVPFMQQHERINTTLAEQREHAMEAPCTNLELQVNPDYLLQSSAKGNWDITKASPLPRLIYGGDSLAAYGLFFSKNRYRCRNRMTNSHGLSFTELLGNRWRKNSTSVVVFFR